MLISFIADKESLELTISSSLSVALGGTENDIKDFVRHRCINFLFLSIVHRKVSAEALHLLWLDDACCIFVAALLCTSTEKCLEFIVSYLM